MYRLIVVFILVAMAVGCYPEQAFRPGPAEFKIWMKSGSTESGVKAQMLSCGYSNPYYVDKDDTMNDRAIHENCMFNNGYLYNYKDKNNDKGICYGQNWEKLPACIEYRKTHP